MAYTQITRPKGDLNNQPAAPYDGRLESLQGVFRLIDAMLAEIYGAPVGTVATFGLITDSAPGAGAITGYSPSGFGTGTGRLDIAANDADTTINDLPVGADGQIVRVRNTGAVGTLILTNANSGSTGSSRFSGIGDVALTPGDSAPIQYYAGSINRWVM